MRNLVLALVVSFVAVTCAFADEFNGSIRKLDVDKGELVVVPPANIVSTAKEAGKPREYAVSKDTKVVDAADKPLDKGIANDRVKVGAKVKIVYKVGEDGKPVVEKIQLTDAK